MSDRDDYALRSREFLRLFPPFSPILILVVSIGFHFKESAQTFRSGLSSGTLLIGCMLLSASIMRRRIHNSQSEYFLAQVVFLTALVCQYLMMRWSILPPTHVESITSSSMWPIWASIWAYVFLYLWSYKLGALDVERTSFDEGD